MADLHGGTYLNHVTSTAFHNSIIVSLSTLPNLHISLYEKAIEDGNYVYYHELFLLYQTDRTYNLAIEGAAQ